MEMELRNREGDHQGHRGREEKIEQKMQGRDLVSTSLWPEKKMLVSKEFMAENRWQL